MERYRMDKKREEKVGTVWKDSYVGYGSWQLVSGDWGFFLSRKRPRPRDWMPPSSRSWPVLSHNSLATIDSRFRVAAGASTKEAGKRRARRRKRDALRLTAIPVEANYVRGAEGCRTISPWTVESIVLFPAAVACYTYYAHWRDTRGWSNDP